MRNDVLQNYLLQFLKCLADNFDNLKFQDASKVAILRPPNEFHPEMPCATKLS